MTKSNVDPQHVLGGAAVAGMTGVLVIGYDRDGQEYFASSYGDAREQLFLIERFKFNLMHVVDEEDEGHEGGAA
jgi:hypothetical protein